MHSALRQLASLTRMFPAVYVNLYQNRPNSLMVALRITDIGPISVLFLFAHITHCGAGTRFLSK